MQIKTRQFIQVLMIPPDFQLHLDYIIKFKTKYFKQITNQYSSKCSATKIQKIIKLTSIKLKFPYKNVFFRKMILSKDII